MAEKTAPDVREAVATDHADLARLRWMWRIEENGEHTDLPFEQFVDAFIDWTRSHSATHIPFIATIDNNIVGMAWLAVVDRVPGPARWHRLAGILQSAYVVPAMRDRGAGAALVRAVIERARALHVGYLAVHPTPKAIPLYRRHGFDETARLLAMELDHSRST